MADLGLILLGIGGLITCLLIAIFVLLVYSGLFESINVGAGSPPIPDVVIAYTFKRGPYKEVGPFFTQVAKLAPDNKALGIYYDDPGVVPAAKQRCIVASILAERDEKVDEALEKKFEDEGYKIMKLPLVTNAVKTTFPYMSRLSIFIAMFKVYPKLAAYVQEHKLSAHPCIEIYDGKTINFMAPLVQQDEFYVPEYHAPETDGDTSLADTSQDASYSYTEPS